MKRTFKVNIVFVFSTLLIATGILITSFTYFRSKTSTLEFVRGSFQEAAVSIIKRTTSYLRSCQILSEISTTVLKDPELEMGLESDLANYVKKVVTLQPQIDLFYYGNEEGEFLQAAILDGNLYTKFIFGTNTQRTALFHYYEGDEVAREETVVGEKYDPRVRPWYKGVKAENATFWTDPYIFHETGKPGITVASPVHHPDGSLKGVVASDITLAGLSAFLNTIELSENGLAFIFEENGALVAYPDPDKMVTIEDGAMRNLHPQELNMPRVTQAIRSHQDEEQATFTYEVDGENHLAYFAKFPDDFDKRWVIAIIAPEDDFLGSMKKTLQLSLLISAFFVGFAVMLGIVLARQLSRPIELLTEEVNKVKDLDLDNKHDIRSPIYEIQHMSLAIANMKQGLKAFQRYVPKSLVKQLVATGEDASVGGKERELTLLFTDIQDFASISESISPKDLMVQLSDYLERISRIIDEETGTVDKYIGDSVMAFWGAPVINDNHAIHACRAALKSQASIQELNDQWEAEGKKPFITRIGVHTGYAIVGNMGSSNRMNYSALGDNVNLASRLEGVNKRYGTRIIISRGTYRYIQNDFVCRVLDQVSVKGKTQGQLIYELLAEKTAPDAEALAVFASAFQEAYDCFIERKWKVALGKLEALEKAHPEDSVTKLYIERCRKYIDNEPDESWTGVTKLG